MAYLIFSIISSSLIYVTFRIAKNYQCNLTSLITLNYLFATILDLLLFQPFGKGQLQNSITWIPFGILLGILFIVMFFLIGKSSQKAGITVTTLANKLSLVFPVMFSLLYFNEQITAIKYIGLAGALISVILTVYKKEINKTNVYFIILPVLIFFGSGIIDSIVKYVQAVKITEDEVSLYTLIVFFVAFLIGIFVSLLNGSLKKSMNISTLLLGIILGSVNFGSLYFFINALNKSNMESSLIFAVNNMSIVALTALIGTMLFKEKLNKINFAGIVLAIVSLYFLL